MYTTLPGGAIVAIILGGLAAAIVGCVILYNKWQARQRALNRF